MHAKDRVCARLLVALMMTCVWGLAVVAEQGATGRDMDLGPFGPQGARMREQLWLLPSGTPGTALRATLFRPADSAPLPDGTASNGAARPLVVINHGTSEATRLAVAMPVYYWLSRWFVERGYLVLLPQRRGHGATGGELVEGRDTCSKPDHYGSGQTAADDIAAAVEFMTQQPFVAREGTIVVGISTGGWASLALATRHLPQVRAIVNFAGGRGGHAWGRPSQICNAEQLIAAAGRYGADSDVASLWLYSGNDSYFGPNLAQAMAKMYSAAGGAAELHVLPPYGEEGHTIADDEAGWGLWGGYLERFLARTRSTSTVACNSPSAGPSIAPHIPISLSTR